MLKAGSAYRALAVRWYRESAPRHDTSIFFVPLDYGTGTKQKGSLSLPMHLRAARGAVY